MSTLWQYSIKETNMTDLNLINEVNSLLGKAHEDANNTDVTMDSYQDAATQDPQGVDNTNIDFATMDANGSYLQVGDIVSHTKDANKKQGIVMEIGKKVKVEWQDDNITEEPAVLLVLDDLDDEDEDDDFADDEEFDDYDNDDTNYPSGQGETASRLIQKRAESYGKEFEQAFEDGLDDDDDIVDDGEEVEETMNMNFPGRQ